MYFEILQLLLFFPLLLLLYVLCLLWSFLFFFFFLIIIIFLKHSLKTINLVVPLWCSELRIWHCHLAAWSLLWWGFDPWPRNFHMAWTQEKKILLYSGIFFFSNMTNLSDNLYADDSQIFISSTLIDRYLFDSSTWVCFRIFYLLPMVTLSPLISISVNRLTIHLFFLSTTCNNLDISVFTPNPVFYHIRPFILKISSIY